MSGLPEVDPFLDHEFATFMNPHSLGHALGANATGVAPPHIAALRDSLPRWRRRIFWSFQVAYWLAIFVAVLGLNKGLKPAETTGLAMLLISAGYMYFAVVSIGTARPPALPRDPTQPQEPVSSQWD